jgi:hypothetical protein
MSIKNPNDAIGNGTRDLPACSAVPQPTAPPRAFFKTTQDYEKLWLGNAGKLMENYKFLF